MAEQGLKVHKLMIKTIRFSIGSLIAGILILAVGAGGALGVKADTLKETSQTLYTGAQIAIIAGVVLIILAAITFIFAVVKSK